MSMVFVLHNSQPARQPSFLTIVNVPQRAGAVLFRPLTITAISQRSSYEVSKRLQAVLIPFLFDQPVKRVGKIIVHRNRQAPHDRLSFS
jgi:hypothetical protein